MLEQDDEGVASHRAFDRTSIGDGIDPVLQFIVLDAPTDPSTAQLLWEASESPIQWGRKDEGQPYQMVEYAFLPADGRLQYRIYSQQSGEELISLRHSRTDSEEGYGVDAEIINGLDDGVYDLHAYLIIPERPTQVLMQRIQVTEFGSPDEFEDEGESDASRVLTLEPGEGFEGVTPQPAAVGNRTTNTMARWDVVPFQRFDGVFEVGVVAHHSYGMDRVAFSFNGGPWRSVSAPSVNPRTGVTEYWAKIDAKSIKDGKVELRAVAYPKNGKPRVLEPLFLWANAGGSVKFPVYEIQAGDRQVPMKLDAPKDRWLTVRYADGVDPATTRVWFNTKTKGNIKLEGLNLRGGPGNQGGGDNAGRVWFDDCTYTGLKSNFKPDAQLTWWLADHAWDAKYYTDVVIDKVQTAFHSGTGIIRNCHVKTVYEDVVRQQGLIVNVKVDKVIAGVPGYVFHPDVFQWYGQNPKNMIVQDFEVKAAGAQGLYPNTKLTDCAFVNVDLNVNIKNRPLQLQDATRNVLIQDSEMLSKIDGVLRWDKNFSAKDIVFRDSTIGAKEPFLPTGWEHPEIRVYPLMNEE